MSSYKSDNELLHEIYFSILPEYAKKEKCSKMNQSRIISYRAQLLTQIQKYLYYLNSSSSTLAEKEAVIEKSKKTIWQHYIQIRTNPGIDTENLSSKVCEFINMVVEWETKKLEEIRNRQVAGERIDLVGMLSGKKRVHAFVNNKLDSFINHNLSKGNFTLVGKDEMILYMTAKGERFHHKDCPYCKGKELLPITRSRACNLNLTACRCIGEMDKIVIEKDEEADIPTEHETIYENPNQYNHSYITVFVDESVRDNHWRDFDNTLPEKQGVYSFLICSGFLTHEDQISNKNLLHTEVRMSETFDGTGMVAKEAITAVLLKLIAENFEGHVQIYTDNTEAMSTWHKTENNRSLAKYFSSVRVNYIPREENTKADNLGRERALANVPASLMKKILENNMKYEAMKAIVLAD